MKIRRTIYRLWYARAPLWAIIKAALFGDKVNKTTARHFLRYFLKRPKGMALSCILLMEMWNTTEENVYTDWLVRIKNGGNKGER